MGWGQGSKGRERQEGWGHHVLPEGVPKQPSGHSSFRVITLCHLGWYGSS